MAHPFPSMNRRLLEVEESDNVEQALEPLKQDAMLLGAGKLEQDSEDWSRYKIKLEIQKTRLAQADCSLGQKFNLFNSLF